MENEKHIIEVGQSFETKGGKTLLCYEVSEMFAFMAPIEEVDGKVFLEVEETVVYQREVVGDTSAPIKNIEIGEVNKAE